MKAYRRTLPAVAALVLLGTACSGNDTTTVTNEIPACSTSYPTGTCATGQSCFQGACVASASLCSPTNLIGTCAPGFSCFGGGCVLTSALPPVTSVLDCTARIYTAQPNVLAHTTVTTKAVLTVDGKQFKDLSGDGALQPYEDWRLPEICRAQDLVTRMTVPQKVALMSETSSIGGGTADGSIPADVQAVIVSGHVRQALIRLGGLTGAQLAAYLNNVQELCETQPLGIPFVVTTDPSHGFDMATNPATGAMTSTESSVVSPWPQPMGLGAINDAAVTSLYGDVVRREFMGMGFRWQLGPMADLATEPRWARVGTTFGENAMSVAKHTAACIEGFQGSSDGSLRTGIAATMKHFPGHGAEEGGKDSHSSWGRFNVYPGGNFEYHQIPFRAAIAAGAAAVMPCYSIFKDQFQYDPLQVSSAYSRGLVTDYLKTELGFSGMVTSDWGIASFAPWGVEALTPAERAALFIKAGSHQFGLDPSAPIQAAYDQGLLDDADIDEAASKILELSFKLGLFEHPYTDAAATTQVRSEANMLAGFDVQKKAIVMLKNQDHTQPTCTGLTCFFLPPVPATAVYLPISGSHKVVSATNTITYVDDTTGDGVVKVYYDGVVDSIVGDPGRPDQVTRWLGDYDYTSAAAANTLAVAATNTLADADIAILRIVARAGIYFGPQVGIPLSFDGAYQGTDFDTTVAASIKDRNKVIDLLRARDGYTSAAGTAVAAVNPNLKIVLVMNMVRPGIVKPFLNGLTTLNETAGVPGSYPTVSSEANIRADGLGGVDAFLVDFGAYDRAVLDFLFNANVPASFAYGMARLPIELPSSDAEVEAQLEDLPEDTLNPSYRLGSGMTY